MNGKDVTDGDQTWLRASRAQLESLGSDSRPPLLADQVVTAAREVALKALNGYLAAQGEELAGAADDLAAVIARCARLDPEFNQLAYAVDTLSLCAADDPSRPCFMPTEDDAAEAVEMAAGILRFVQDRV